MVATTTIPTIFDQPGAAFVLLQDGIKSPPIEKEWEKHPHTFAEATAHRGNVGVVAGNGQTSAWMRMILKPSKE